MSGAGSRDWSRFAEHEHDGAPVRRYAPGLDVGWAILPGRGVVVGNIAQRISPGSAGGTAEDLIRRSVDARKGVWQGRGREEGVRGGFGRERRLKSG